MAKYTFYSSTIKDLTHCTLSAHFDKFYSQTTNLIHLTPFVKLDRNDNNVSNPLCICLYFIEDIVVNSLSHRVIIVILSINKFNLRKKLTRGEKCVTFVIRGYNMVSEKYTCPLKGYYVVSEKYICPLKRHTIYVISCACMDAPIALK